VEDPPQVSKVALTLLLNQTDHNVDFAAQQQQQMNKSDKSLHIFVLITMYCRSGNVVIHPHCIYQPKHEYVPTAHTIMTDIPSQTCISDMSPPATATSVGENDGHRWLQHNRCGQEGWQV
jgi:hypothetical protein